MPNLHGSLKPSPIEGWSRKDNITKSAVCGATAQETENLRLLRLSATQAGRTGARAARSSGGWMLHNGPLRLTLTRRVVPVLSQNRELPWGGLAQVRGRKGSARAQTMPSKKWLSIQEIAPLFHRPIVDVAGAPPPIEKPCHSGGGGGPVPPPYPTLCSILQRRLASARRCSRRSVDGTAFGAGRSASCRA